MKKVNNQQQSNKMNGNNKVRYLLINVFNKLKIKFQNNVKQNVLRKNKNVLDYLKKKDKENQKKKDNLKSNQNKNVQLNCNNNSNHYVIKLTKNKLYNIIKQLMLHLIIRK